MMTSTNYRPINERGQKSFLLNILFIVQIHISRLGETKGVFFLFKHSHKEKYNNYLHSLVKNKTKKQHKKRMSKIMWSF